MAQLIVILPYTVMASITLAMTGSKGSKGSKVKRLKQNINISYRIMSQIKVRRFLELNETKTFWTIF